ncbi:MULTISPECIES: Dabb family protein [unclassified Microbacterium]|uniref:Dabb family protein n=1 Tax=unclassified Microbacterium TaxID=2609290 RepID=UPI0003FB38A5|nr:MULTISPECIES: Dabb family protein [unclassified Microbacterium]PQZ55990.1 stress responsive protein [Microbacterium sp. MYb43]PQZ78558.1 stress responsive protein [Microbacterium sp. MYb40]PRB22666.1 stress responsive protein [Microbacterium sp. MYb54]PRB26763.1 stress responsive protein [Microbacterium sp. MYb50]PRB68932.1 stress responsive protein [Microbacterium sp. MYb24]
MSIQHTVVFRLIHPAGSAEEREFLATGHAVLTSIPGVEDFTIRRQVSAKSDLSHQFSMVFTDQHAYDAYDGHPAHRAFVSERWLPEVATFQEYDFVE